MSFIDPTTYGLKRKASYIPLRPGMTPPFLEEPPELEAPQSTIAPPPLEAPRPTWGTSGDMANEYDKQSDTALEDYKKLAMKPPKLEYKKGALGVLQRIGDAVVRPDIMHPNYTRDVQNYETDLDAQGKVVKAAGAMADDARKRAQYESELSRNAKQEALYERQMQTESRKQDELGRREYKPVGSHGYTDDKGVFHPAAPDAPQPSAAVLRQQASYRRTDLLSKKKSVGLDAKEQAELDRIEAYFKKEDADIERSKSQTVLNVNTVPGRTAAGDVTLETLEDKRRAQRVRDDADYVLAEAARLGTDPNDLAANIMNPRFFTAWGDDQARRSAVVAEIQARNNKKKKESSSLIDQLGKPKPQGATPVAAPNPTGPAKTATRADVEEFAKANGMTYPQAKNAAIKDGYIVQE